MPPVERRMKDVLRCPEKQTITMKQIFIRFFSMP